MGGRSSIAIHVESIDLPPRSTVIVCLFRYELSLVNWSIVTSLRYLSKVPLAWNTTSSNARRAADEEA